MFSRHDVPLSRAAMWGASINLERREMEWCKEVQGVELAQYQLDALDTLLLGGGLLSLDTGLGKTLATVSACITLSTQYGKRCFICAPVNALGAWQPYIETLQQHFEEVALVSIDSLHKLKGLSSEEGGVVVWDEVHLLGEATTKRTKEAHDLRRKFDIGIALTGTLLHAGVKKALSILDLVVPGLSLFSSFWAAGEYFHCLVKKEIDGVGTVTDLEKPTGPNFENFADYVTRCGAIVKKHSEAAKEAGIPAQHSETIKLGEPWGSIEDCVVEWARQYVAEHNEFPQVQTAVAALRREGLDKKLEWLTMWLTQNKEPVVLFGWSLESLATMQQYLQSLAMPYVYVDGGVTGKNRVQAVEDFQQGKVDIFLGQIDASCVSVNLYRARYSIALEHTNRSANYDQALGRTCRRGQHQECYHYDLVTNPLQLKVLERLRAGVNFDSSVAEWATMRDTIYNL